MKIKTLILKLSETEKANAIKARKPEDKTWEDFFNRLIDKENE